MKGQGVHHERDDTWAESLRLSCNPGKNWGKGIQGTRNSKYEWLGSGKKQQNKHVIIIILIAGIYRALTKCQVVCQVLYMHFNLIVTVTL